MLIVQQLLYFFIVDILLISYSIGTSDCKPVILYISLAESFRRESENVNQIPRTTLALETVIVAATNTALQVEHCTYTVILSFSFFFSTFYTVSFFFSLLHYLLLFLFLHFPSIPLHVLLSQLYLQVFQSESELAHNEKIFRVYTDHCKVR